MSSTFYRQPTFTDTSTRVPPNPGHRRLRSIPAGPPRALSGGLLVVLVRRCLPPADEHLLVRVGEAPQAMRVDHAQPGPGPEDSVVAQLPQRARERLGTDLQDTGEHPLLDVERTSDALHLLTLPQEAGDARDGRARRHRAVAAMRRDFLEQQIDDGRSGRMRRAHPRSEVLGADAQQAHLRQGDDVDLATPAAEQLRSDERVRTAHRRPDLVTFRVEAGDEDGALAHDQDFLQPVPLRDEDGASAANDLADLHVPGQSQCDTAPRSDDLSP